MGTPGPAAKATPEERLRAQKCLDRRIAGESWQAIADAEGYSDRSGPFRAVESLLSRVEHASVDQYRVIELARLDELQAGLWKAAIGGDVKAVNAVLGVVDRRVKLLGLNMPDRLVVAQHTVSSEEFAVEAAKLMTEIGLARADHADGRDYAADPWV
ncbi:hypothetical protein CH272_08275 [Rhodococcus sp. 05-340-1]|uniref:hypothetical protein n=1 Tax=unclassified Rhodococcus (in: high G+C Gram-positive bacteria) TaxID=192944 RepID=UPI000B9B32D6|nr:MULTISPECIES: hypothetical protein [unclassified Rhodococcus (in: high G+C Gram-positive bacteria)]OZD66691.1 hypothetical protein CH271_17440 [Rhodococcus sp. 05-340-2]OZD80768.1 hypothetical protein CH272_08275 [Rhodococcus sp. 05-340-1]